MHEQTIQTAARYDAVIAGGGHNGLVCACYLAMAGRSVLILEKNDYVGGATYSKEIFPGVAARVSVYSYLISLLPQKILTDLGIKLEIRRRAVASYSTVMKNGQPRGLLMSNVSDDVTRQSFIELTGDDREYYRYQKLQEMQSIFAQKVWPTLIQPLPSKAALQRLFQGPEEGRIWDYMVEQPISAFIEDHLEDDTVRGAVFTDAKIGVHTWADDPSLLQNRTFIYHTVGQGTGEWRVPVGGMGALASALKEKAAGLGVDMKTRAEVVRVVPGKGSQEILYLEGDKEKAVQAQYVLFNTSSDIANRCLPGLYDEEQSDGSVFKLNMVLRKLPTLKDSRVTGKDAFTGTFHLDEGYEQMAVSFKNVQVTRDKNDFEVQSVPGEIYCHSLTDPSILSEDLIQQGYQTLTLFGVDVPYHWFVHDNARMRDAVSASYLRAINRYIVEDIRDCLARDSNGKLCLEAKSPLDLESGLGLPRGNIFHGNLTWPFAENDDQAGMWGVETAYENILMCGSSAMRGGAVSGIPGHNAAMKVLGISES